MNLRTIREQELYLSDREVAAVLGVSVALVRKWRLLGKGPVYRRLGRAVRYCSTDLGEWLKNCPTGGGR